MPSENRPNRRLLDLFSGQPCWMIEPLAAQMRYSIPSLRRFLAEAGYFRSFSHNGRWYTLRSIPKFNSDGLWFFRDIGFSRSGSLTDTLVHLTTDSPAGMTAEQLGSKLQCRCHSILVHLCRNGRIHRQKWGRSFVYLAADSHLAAIQRNAMSLKDASEIELPAEIAVLILAEFIRNPESSFEQVAGAISRQRKVTVRAAQVERLFELHGLKKTTPTGQPRP